MPARPAHPICLLAHPPVLQKQLGAAGDVGFKQAMQSKWVAIDKSGGEPRVVRKVDSIQDRVLAVLTAVAEGKVRRGGGPLEGGRCGCWLAGARAARLLCGRAVEARRAAAGGRVARGVCRGTGALVLRGCDAPACARSPVLSAQPLCLTISAPYLLPARAGLWRQRR